MRDSSVPEFSGTKSLELQLCRPTTHLPFGEDDARHREIKPEACTLRFAEGTQIASQRRGSFRTEVKVQTVTTASSEDEHLRTCALPRNRNQSVFRTPYVTHLKQRVRSQSRQSGADKGTPGRRWAAV